MTAWGLTQVAVVKVSESSLCVTSVLPDWLMATVTSAAGWLASSTVYALLSPSGTVSVAGVSRTPGGAPTMPMTVSDQGPGCGTLTARTWTSYRTAWVRPVRSYDRSPAVQTPVTTVQLGSALSASLGMYRTS